MNSNRTTFPLILLSLSRLHRARPIEYWWRTLRSIAQRFQRFILSGRKAHIPQKDTVESAYLVGVGVEEILFLVWAEQRVGVFVQRLWPRLEALTAHVEPDPLVGRAFAHAGRRSCRRRDFAVRRPTRHQVHGRRKPSLGDRNPPDGWRPRERQPRSNRSHVSRAGQLRSAQQIGSRTLINGAPCDGCPLRRVMPNWWNSAVKRNSTIFTDVDRYASRALAARSGRN